MEEDDFLVEAARWARHYERANEIIQSIKSANVADVPSQEIIDNPQGFRNWVDQCEKICEARNKY